eukprot:GHVS01015728.1.p1 GENE.GHVS01015728.1~~GHVS01015728.1.p1  ORF type:complete len:558 (+),score=110.89 GHVS01015728.1:363-2036(+)
MTSASASYSSFPSSSAPLLYSPTSSSSSTTQLPLPISSSSFSSIKPSSSSWCSQSTRAALVVVGGLIFHLTLGTLYTWGNMSGYVSSYMRNVCGLDVRLKDTGWLFSALFGGQSVAMPLGGWVEKKLGPRWTCLIGGSLMCFGIFISKYTLSSFSWFILTYGFTYGFGLGFAYTAPLVCALKWYPNRKGLISGIITAGFGGGALLFNFVQTSYINPYNVQPDDQPFLPESTETYFSSDSILSRVPQMMAVLSSSYMLIQLGGVALLVDPPVVVVEEGSNSRTPLLLQEKTSGGQMVFYDAAKDYKQQHGGEASTKKTPSEVASGDQLTKNVQQQQKQHSSSSSAGCITVAAALCSNRFVILFLLFLINGLSISFTATFWKSMGGNMSDRTLSLVGCLGSFCNAAGRLGWGMLADWCNCRIALVYLSGLWTACMLLFPIAASWSSPAYVLLVCLNFFCLGGNFSLFPTATAHAFGREFFGPIYGFMYFSQFVASLSVAFLAQQLIMVIGSSGVALIMSCCCAATCLTSIALPHLGVDLNSNIGSKQTNSRCSGSTRVA